MATTFRVMHTRRLPIPMPSGANKPFKRVLLAYQDYAANLSLGSVPAFDGTNRSTQSDTVCLFDAEQIYVTPP